MELTTSAGIALQDAIAARYFLILFEPSRKVALRKTPLAVMPRKRHFSSDALPLLLAGVGGFLCVCVSLVDSEFEAGPRSTSAAGPI